MYKRYNAILEHPYTIKKDANRRVSRYSTTTITRHLQTLAY
jgi:DNA polymerase III delta subunit